MATIPIQFKLTEEMFKNCNDLLASRGIEVRPESQTTEVKLPDNTITYTNTTGKLRFDGCECDYCLSLQSGKPLLDIYESMPGDTTVKFIEELRQIFPQPGRGIVRHSNSKVLVAMGNALNLVGCLGIIAFLLAICFFAVVGVLSYFK